MGKPSILFVDDDPNILSALQRMLYGKRREWDISFASDSEQAKELLKEQVFDVVISDMRMPKIDGAELLSFVERTNPGTVRIVLSGYSEGSSILRTVGPAHRYIAKPCEAQILVAILEDAVTLRSSFEESQLKTLVSSLRNLPTPSDIYFRLVSEIDSPKGSVASVARIISSDIAMTAELLKLTNSSFFAVAGPVSSPLQAVRMLGFETVKALALNVGLFRQFSGNRRIGPLLARLNAYGGKLSTLARCLAADIGANAEDREAAFCAGMLSQIGALVLMDQLPDSFSQVLKRIAKKHNLLTSEQDIFHADHAVLGGYLLGLWGFPVPIRQAVTYQFAPSSAGKKYSALTALHIALTLGPDCPFLEEGCEGCMRSLDVDYFKTFGIEMRPEKWKALAAAVVAGKEVGDKA